jgi:putative ABC transport system substrate-binding protein
VDRRAFLVTLSGGLLAAPLAAGAQDAGKVPRIGLIRPGSPPDPYVEAFRQGLRELAYVEGRTIAIEYRWAEGKPERIPEFAADLVRREVAVIVTANVSQVLKRVTTTIPLVSPNLSEELVASLGRPGGNITGVSLTSRETTAKRLDVLRETLPKVSRVAVLRDPRTAYDVGHLKSVAAALRLDLRIFVVQGLDDIEKAFAAAKQARAGAVNVLDSAFFTGNTVRIVEAARKTRLPAIYQSRAFVDAGGFMSYGPNLPEVYRRLASYVDKILKGTKPADLPVEQPTKFEFVISLKAARALGVVIPSSVLARADEVIE